MPVSAEHQLLAEPVRVQLPAQLRATPDQLLLQEPGDSLFLSLRTLEDPHFRRMQAALQLLSVVHSPQLLETADAFALRLFPHHGRSLYHVLVSVLRIARPLPSPRILTLLSSLQKLSLSHCSQLSGEFAITVVKNCSQLRCLDISHCRHLSQDALQKLFTITFSELDVSCIPALTDDSLRFFLPYCDFLTSLRMESALSLALL